MNTNTNDYQRYLAWAQTQSYKGQPITPYTPKQWDTMSPINRYGIMLQVNRAN